jgi:muramoyltetrapeptide carboxypeptidase
MFTRVAPKSLFPGAVIGAFSPSDPVGALRKPRVDAGVAALSRADFVVQYSEYAFVTERGLGGLRGRVEDIFSLATNPKVNGMIATHGGKSCIDLLTGGLDFELIRHARKPIIGFSDVCVLLNAITAKTGLITFYGPNVLSKIEQSAWSDLRSLNSSSTDFGRRELITLGGGNLCVRAGDCVGHLFGGNLECYINSLLLSGSDYRPGSGGVFFWESSGITAGEAYQVFRALRMSGFLESLSGMIIGDAFRDKTNTTPQCLEVVLEACSNTQFPILYSPTFGHAEGLENPILPIGANVHLDSRSGVVEALQAYIVVSDAS